MKRFFVTIVNPNHSHLNHNAIINAQNLRDAIAYMKIDAIRTRGIMWGDMKATDMADGTVLEERWNEWLFDQTEAWNLKFDEDGMPSKPTKIITPTKKPVQKTLF